MVGSNNTTSAQAIFTKRKLQENTAAFDIKSGEIIDGDMPNRAAEMIREWISLNKNDLLEIWETQEFRKLDPLD